MAPVTASSPARDWSASELIDLLTASVGKLLSRLIVESSLTICGANQRTDGMVDLGLVVDEMERRVKLFAMDETKREEGLAAIAAFRGRHGEAGGPGAGLDATPAVLVQETIARHTARAVASVIVSAACRNQGLRVSTLRWKDMLALQPELCRLVKNSLREDSRRRDCLADLAAVIQRHVGRHDDDDESVTVHVASLEELARLRTATWQLTERLGFDAADQAKITVATSALAANIVHHAREGFVQLAPVRGARRGIRIIAQDSGPGIANVRDVLAGNGRQREFGLREVGELMDEFKVETGPERGTMVTAVKYLR